MCFIVVFSFVNSPNIFSVLIPCHFNGNAVWQNTLKDVKHISSSEAYLSLNDQIEKSKAELDQYQLLWEKQQVVTGW